MPSTRYIAGAMTGTSIDALDVALVRIDGSGLDMRASFIAGHAVPLDDLKPRLRALAEQQPTTAGDIARLSREFALAHVSAFRELFERAGQHADLISVHGQTVFHQPPLSWQMFNGAVLAHDLSTPVVFDLRAADLAAGGQGAPITPIADWIFFRSEKSTAVINLGGFCNATLLPEQQHSIDHIEGFDVCACNHVLDQLARIVLRCDFDKDGERALNGRVHADALVDLEGVLKSQSASKRSLGTGDETAEWISRWRSHAKADDLCATACEALGETIAKRVQGTQRILLAGGGARNAALVRAIGGWSSCKVESTNAAGLPVEYREAAAMAVLGALCQDRVPITLPKVTGVAAAPISGVWTEPAR
jgi:1,6-anhydro-N-acetylmuramate kinase